MPIIKTYKYVLNTYLSISSEYTPIMHIQACSQRQWSPYFKPCLLKSLQYKIKSSNKWKNTQTQ